GGVGGGDGAVGEHDGPARRDRGHAPETLACPDAREARPCDPAGRAGRRPGRALPGRRPRGDGAPPARRGRVLEGARTDPAILPLPRGAPATPPARAGAALPAAGAGAPGPLARPRASVRRGVHRSPGSVVERGGLVSLRRVR